MDTNPHHLNPSKTLVSGNVLMHEHYSRETTKLDPQTGLSQTVAYCSQQRQSPSILPLRLPFADF